LPVKTEKCALIEKSGLWQDKDAGKKSGLKIFNLAK